MAAGLREAGGAALAPDWSQPWLAPYRERGQVLQARWQSGLPLAEALNAALADGPIELAAGSLRFVPQAELPEGEGYEAFIHRTACVPTRENWHDFFNGLVWLQQPALKVRLNAWHADALAAGQGEGASQRGPLRDALTLLDENAAFLQAPAALAAALRARDWRRLFIELRPLWREARLRLFGHALMEKLMQPRKPICAHVLLVPDVEQPAAALSAALLAAKPFLPLPVLGVPGWWPENEVPDFYADAGVFRPAASAQTS